MYNILYEFNYYDGPLEGICQKSDGSIYYYCITKRSDIHNDGPRSYYLYKLDGDVGKALTPFVVAEKVLRKEA